MALTIEEAAERYLARGTAAGWAEPTQAQYRTKLQGLSVFLRTRGCRAPADVCPADLDAYMQHLLDKGRARSSRVQIATTIRCFFAALQQDGAIITNPSRAMPVPEDGEPNLPPTPPSAAEVQAIIDGLPRATVFDLRNRCLVELLYGCGLRRGEAAAMDVDDLDLSRRTLHVRHGKGSQQRVLPLMSAAIAAVRDYLALRRTLLVGPDRGALFLGQAGTRWTVVGIAQWFDRLNDHRGPSALHLHPHLLRHAIAVHLLRGGADIRYIQQFLGHADLDTTRIYLRLVPGRLKEDYDRAMPDIVVEPGLVIS